MSARPFGKIFTSPLSCRPATIVPSALIAAAYGCEIDNVAFNDAHPEAHVSFTFGPSDGLATQIVEGAPVDVFASASPTWMDLVETDGPGVRGRTDFARNRLAIVVPAGNPAGIEGIADLAREGVQLVLAAEGVPAGDYARQILENAGIADAALANVVSNEEDVALVLTKVLSGAQRADSGDILINGERKDITNPRDAKDAGIETIYQTLALADNLDAPANLFLWRELTTRLGNLDDDRMEDATRKVMGRLNPNFQKFTMPVKSLSGGQRQAVAIARAVYFNAKILIMDEPTAALGPAETAQVRHLVRQLKAEGIGIFLISHDIHDVYDLADRVSVMYHGRIVDTVDKESVTTDDILGMIILGKKPGDVTDTERESLEPRGELRRGERPARAPDRAPDRPRGGRDRRRHQAPVTPRSSS